MSPGESEIECTTDSELFESVSSTDSASSLHVTDARGNSFTVSEAIYLSKITVYLTASDGDDYATLRWGTSSNLGTYEDEVTGVLIPNGTNSVTFDIDNTTFELQTSTAYYFGIICTTGAANISRMSAGDYANGYMTWADGTGWDMAYLGVNTYDTRFSIYKCTN